MKEKESRTPEWPYKSLSDPKYLKDKDSILSRSGNGWWWGWTAENCPLDWMKPQIIAQRKKEMEENKKDWEEQQSLQDKAREERDKRYKEEGIGSFIDCIVCGKETVMISMKTKYCSKNCGDKAYKQRLKEKQEQKREYMREKRKENPDIWRK